MNAKTKFKKSFQEKLKDSKGLPKVIELTGKLKNKWGSGTMIIPAPIEVNELMKKIPKGKLTTINKLREKLAKKHNTTIACPITTGIFAWISANAAEEAKAEGKKNITPYWRTLKSNGELNEKYPGGINQQKNYLNKEGFIIEQLKSNKPPKVKNFEKYII